MIGDFQPAQCSSEAPAGLLRTARRVCVALCFALCSSSLMAGSALRPPAASASCSVSITIPRITGIDLSIPAVSAVSSAGPRVTIRLFETGVGAILIRTDPREGATRPFQTVSLASTTNSSQIIAATSRGGWQALEESIPVRKVQRTAARPQVSEVTYEIWKF